MPPPHLLRLLLPTLALAACASVRAEGADELRLRASAGLLHDSNLFRLPSSANPLPLIGRASAAETIAITSLGVNYNKAYSLQRVELDFSVNDYRYQTFNYLDFIAYNYRGAWRWSYTPHLYGNLSTSRNQTLNSFVDFQGFNQRNLRTDTNLRADTTYELGANWRLVGGLSRSSRTNLLPIADEGDYRFSAIDAGVRYVLPSGSSAAYIFKSTDGTYTKRPAASAGFFDKDFTQTDNELQLTWIVSPDTSASVRAGYRNRDHPNYPQRDFSGVVGSANFNWAITPKSVFVAAWTRELGAYQSANSNYSQSDRFSIGPSWRIGPKTAIRANLAHEIRNFRGTPIGVETSRRDTTRDASVSLDWQPFTYLALNASLQNARRSSNLPGLDFTSNMVSLTAQFTY